MGYRYLLLSCVFMFVYIETTSAIEITPITTYRTEYTYQPTPPAPPGTIATMKAVPVTTYSFELTQEQIDAVGEQVNKITTTIVDSLDMFKKIKGVFDLFSDASGDFDVSLVALGDDEYGLEFLPIGGPILLPGVYGDITWSFAVNPVEWSTLSSRDPAGYVEFVSSGPSGEERLYKPLEQTYVPEPATLALLALGGIVVLRRR